MTITVAQWGTGYVGRQSLRSIILRDDLELVGTWVHSPQKHGVDAGLLAGVQPVGVTATTNARDIVDLHPDCVVYMARSADRVDGVVEDLAMLLRNGINVANIALPDLFYPTAGRRELVEPLERAALEGGATLFTSGIDPGMANAGLALNALDLVREVRTVTMLQVLNLSHWDNAETIFEHLGFGQRDVSHLEHLPPARLISAWGPLLHLVAHRLGVELDEIDTVIDVEYCDEGFFVTAGVVPDGTISVVRYQVRGLVDGEPLVIYERVNRLRDQDAPMWPQGEGFRVDIAGDPNVHLEMSLSLDDGYVNDAAVVAAANHILSAVPFVVAERPGIISMLDVPTLGTARGTTAGRT